MTNTALLLLGAAESVEQLPPTTRAIAMMALLAILLLVLLYVVFVLLGGHWVRRIGSHRRGQAVPPDRERIRRAPASENLPDTTANQGDTINDRPGGGTTIS